MNEEWINHTRIVSSDSTLKLVILSEKHHAI